MTESFGWIGVKLSTPYTRLARYYSNQEWDMIGLYYPNENGFELVLYDVYSSSRIRGVSAVGELLLWESVTEISSKKFYNQGEEVEAVLASLIITTLDSPEVSLERLITEDDYQSQISSLFDKRLTRFQVQQSAESIYRRSSLGLASKPLEQAYEALHEKLFDTLKKLNADLYDIFHRKPIVREKVFVHPLINRLYEFLEKQKNSLPGCFEINRDELNLGEQSFQTALVVRYDAQVCPRRQLELKCTNLSIILSSESADLSFLDKKALIEILKYIEACQDGSFTKLEAQILLEIANRDMSSS